jgi:cytochrome c-type biogenesis protein
VIADAIGHGIDSWWAPALAFAAGAVSCASPCVLPLIPGYVAFVAGGDAAEKSSRTVLVPILLFVAGFTVVFTLVFGLSASSLSRWLRLPVGQQIAGGFVIAFGLLMLLYGLKAPVSWLYREGRPLLARVGAGRGGAFPLGMAFAVGWTPCIGPVLGLILTLAAAQGGTLRGMLLLLFYSLGLGLPILLLGIGTRWAMASSTFVSRNYQWFAGLSGAAMVTIGVLLVTGLWVQLLSPLLRYVVRFSPVI